MSPRIAVLTTETAHHAFFAAELLQRYPDLCLIVEQRQVRAKFETEHAFERQRDSYEIDLWFDGSTPKLRELAPTTSVETINDPEAASTIRRFAPDVVLSFGVRRLKPHMIDLALGTILNLHGGDPEAYRGLDSHLWAVYHGDFSGLVTTLHHLNTELDDGAIVLQGDLPLRQNMQLFELRSVNTHICVELAQTALAGFERTGRFPRRAQRKKGRYYSFMPAVLKDTCVRAFWTHTQTL